MKRNILAVWAAAVCAVSCNFLDISPDVGLSQEDVFTNLTNYQNYLGILYKVDHGKTAERGTQSYLNLTYGSYPMRMDASDTKVAMLTLTEIADVGRPNMDTHKEKTGTMGDGKMKMYVNGRVPIFMAGWSNIRVANMCIENIDKLKDAPQEEKDDILAQAYFIRAWSHMTMCNFFGGLPYVDHVLGGDEDWDLQRESAILTYQKAAADFKTAYEYFVKCGRVRRDPFPGEPGHLEHSLQDRPNGVAAMALRGRALLYAASPLTNINNDKQLWIDAAEANAEALAIAREYRYELLSWSNWTDNTWGAMYSNEQLWAHNFGKRSINHTYLRNLSGYPFNNDTAGGGMMPTQNSVDMYETIWGDPLYYQEERDAAYACTGEGVAGPDGQLHHYYEQNPYENRDPRMSKIIVYDGATCWQGTDGKPINIYYDNDTKKWPTTSLNSKNRSFGAQWNSKTNSTTSTGYYYGGRWDGTYVKNTYNVTDPLIRLAEVYLNYAEAVNEAYGPNGKAGGESMTALDAVNAIRNRATMPDVQKRFTGSTETLRPRIQNERNVEFMFEGHHYFIDERRWKIAPERMRAGIMGMYIETVPKDATYPNGKRYTRKPILYQSGWKDAMYYFFLHKDEANKLKKFVNNETW